MGRGLSILFLYLFCGFGVASAQNDEGLACGAQNVDQAIECLRSNLSEEDHLLLVNGPFEDMIKYHRNIGMSMRNSWGFWSGKSDLSKFFLNTGIQHPDDMSGIILDSYWLQFNACDLQLDQQVAYYQSYWEGLDKNKLEAGQNRPVILSPKPALDCTNRG